MAIAYKSIDTIKFQQYDGTYSSYQSLMDYFELDQMIDPWIDEYSPLTLNQIGAFLNVNGTLVKYLNPYTAPNQPDAYRGFDWDGDFMTGWTLDQSSLDPVWAADKPDYATIAYADSLVMSGPEGPQGEQGIQGEKGDKGDTGNTGSSGIITLTTTGTGAATYNSGTATLNIPTVTGASGTYGAVTVSNGLVSSGKRMEVYSGTTNSSGVYTVTFPVAFSVAPNIQASITNQSSTNQYLRVSNISTTGFTINAYSFSTNTLLGIVSLISTTTNINSASIDVLITEK